MAGIIDVSSDVEVRAGEPASPSETEGPPGGPIRLWQRLALVGVTLISVFMNFYQLGTNGFGNLYYAAGVRSMLDSWYNFFFVSFDPGGFVTIDKPPLGFWVQAVSAKLFGFTAFAVLLPQALAGVLSVLILYWLVRRHFGPVAGLLAALALAVSPISVVTNRNNTIDSVLALVMLLGAWAVIRAAETGKLRWLLLCATLVGLGFNIKMLQAYLAVPAYGILYLLAAPRKIWLRLAHLGLALLLMLTVSLAWVITVDLTPATQRPYVGSSQDNSALSLALGYNGISRLLGISGGNGGPVLNNNGGSFTPPTNVNVTPPNGSGANNQDNGPLPEFRIIGGMGGFMNRGLEGPFRLFNGVLGGQISWLLPFALLAIVALAWQKRPRFRLDSCMQSLLLWGTWLLTMGIFFSVAEFYHEYYFTVMAPAIAALFGIGIVVMWRDYRTTNWRGWLLPIALAVTVAEQVSILSKYPVWSSWMTPLITGVGGATVVGLALARFLPIIREHTRALTGVLSAGAFALLIGPAVWGIVPVLNGTASQLPIAGPMGAFSGMPGRILFNGSSGEMMPNNPVGGRMPGGPSDEHGADEAMIRYLQSHQGTATYLVATISAQGAQTIILATNEPVMALGGFSGSDPILTTDELAVLVKNGTVRYFLLEFGGPGGIFIENRDQELMTGKNASGSSQPIRNGGGPEDAQANLSTWVTANCTAVPSSEWLPSSTGSTSNGGNRQLYDCASAGS